MSAPGVTAMVEAGFDNMDRGGIVVSRPRVAAEISRGVAGPMTIVTAPAGYGKTFALVEWAAGYASRPVACAILKKDDDRRRVRARLLAAVGRLSGDMPAALRHQLHSDSLVDGYFSEDLSSGLAGVGKAVLIVEGLDVPTETGLVEELAVVIRRLPPNVHVIVTRRSFWPASLQSLLASNDVTAIGVHELAFTADEARTLVRRCAATELTNAQVDVLMARTEGWPAALNVAAVALRGVTSPDAVIDGLRGTDKHIAAFLRNEVLAQERSTVRRFLVRTAVLDTLTPAVCTAVSGEMRAGRILLHLERAGAFIRRAGPGEDRFVQHAMLRDVLRHELRTRQPGAERELMVRAALGHLHVGEPEHAAPYLIEAEEWDELICLLDRHGRALLDRGLGPVMLEWLGEIPRSSPYNADVQLRRALILMILGREDEAAEATNDARQAQGGRRVATVVNVLRSTSVFVDAPARVAIDAADAALEAVEGLENTREPAVLGLSSGEVLHAIARASRARGMWCLGDVEGSRRELTELAAQANVFPIWRLQILGALALVEAWAGNLSRAKLHAARALMLARSFGTPDHPLTVDAYLALAHVARERADLAEAGALLDVAYDLTMPSLRQVPLGIHAIERAKWHLATGNPSFGLAEIDAYRAVAGPPQPIIDNHLRATEVHLLIALGELDRAEAVLTEAAQPGWPAVLCGAAVHVAVARHDMQAARRRLETWSAPAAEPRIGLERNLWQAVTDFEVGKRRAALDRLAETAAAARSEGHVRLFLDAGASAERLLRSLPRVEPANRGRVVVPGRDSTFSPRELEVMRFLPTPLSNAEMAAQLFVSLNTLKTHLRAVYRKLGVSSRREAIVRAEELGLA